MRKMMLFMLLFVIPAAAEAIYWSRSSEAPSSPGSMSLDMSMSPETMSAEIDKAVAQAMSTTALTPPVTAATPSVNTLVIVPPAGPLSSPAGSPWQYTASATGGTPPYTWLLTQSPEGGNFVVDPVAGVLSGSSQEPVSLVLRIAATDAAGAIVEQDVNVAFVQNAVTPYSVSDIVAVETTGIVVGASDALTALTDEDDNTYVSIDDGGSVTYRFDSRVVIGNIARRNGYAGCAGEASMAVNTYGLDPDGVATPAKSSKGGGTCAASYDGQYAFGVTANGFRVEYTGITPAGTSVRLMQLR